MNLTMRITPMLKIPTLTLTIKLTIALTPTPNSLTIPKGFRIRTLQESANHPHKTNVSCDNLTTQPNASKEQTQYKTLASSYEQTI
jgi:hypothetical protein